MNAGDYDKKIAIYKKNTEKDADGFPKINENEVILSPYAKIKTTKGFTLIVNNSDFEKAYTNFTIRYPKEEKAKDILLNYREMIISYKGKNYDIEYANNVDESNVEIEMQARAVTK